MTLISVLRPQEIADPYGYSDEEVAELEEEARRVEMLDMGYYDMQEAS